jgi:hypothetical protein
MNFTKPPLSIADQISKLKSVVLFFIMKLKLRTIFPILAITG